MSSDRSPKPTIASLNQFRGIAILGVVMVHATSQSVVSLSGKATHSGALLFYTLCNTLALFCVPAFVFLTGVMLFYNYFDRTMSARAWRAFYHKRVLYLVIPYVAATFIYHTGMFFLLRHEPMAWSNMDKYASELRLKLLNGTGYWHLYYVLITIQLYALFPLIRAVLLKWRGLIAWLILAGFAIQWGFYGFHRFVTHFPAKGTIALSYFAPFLLGAWVGIYYERMRGWLRPRSHTSLAGVVRAAVCMMWACSALLLTMVWYKTRLHNRALHSLWYEGGYSLFTYTTILVLLYAVHYGASKRGQGRRSVLNELGTLSFGIYLVHPGFLLLYRKLSPSVSMNALYHVWVAGGFVLSLILSIVLLLLAYRYMPASQLMLGKVSDRYVGKQEELPARLEPAQP